MPPKCPQCKTVVDNPGDFCSTECEQAYGECPGCGSPSRDNRRCMDCREP